MASFGDWVRWWFFGPPDEQDLAMQLLDTKEAAAVADIRALCRRADEQILGLARRSAL
jgi:hypothetical protein